ILVGNMPLMIKPTKDCKTIVVANEARAFGSTNSFQNPLGSVGIIRFTNGVENNYEYTELNFTKFNDKQTDLEKEGVRFVFRENTFDRDIEPESITFNCDETIAYVALQENNAIAIVDVRKLEIDEIKGLGYKTWDKYTLDTSDKDGGIHMNNYDFIRSFYLPDRIKYHHWNDEGIIITADEGAYKSYSNSFNEKRRGNWFNPGKSLSKRYLIAIENFSCRLGRLFFSKLDGLDNTRKYENLYFYGGRGFTIRKASDMSILFDSGDTIERKISELAPEIFNSNYKGGQSINQQRDTQSDNKGPECEAVETAEIDGKLVILLGCERPGTIVVFSVGDDFKETKFEYLYFNIPEYDKRLKHLYTKRKISEINPENFKYVGFDKSPNGQNILFVVGKSTGTLSAIDVDVEKWSKEMP
ncbi:hypothetical protein LOTGIDRAFT_111904, partial [Lottia gigantea]